MNKSNITFALTIISGIIIGGFIGDVLARIPFLGWLDYGKSIGLTSPLFVDLSFLTFTFGFTIDLTIAGVIGMVIAMLIYKKM